MHAVTKDRRLASSLAVVAIATVFACGHQGQAPDPSTASAPEDSASASESTASNPGQAPNMDDVAEDGSCAGANCLRRCDNKGRPLDCTAAGDALRSGADGLTPNVKRAVQYLDKACGLKSRDACHHLSQIFVAGEGGVPADAARSMILLDEACELGQGAACGELARKAETGEGAKKDHAKAIGYLASGCAAEAFDEGACAGLVEAVGKKDKDAARVLEDWKKQCKATKDTVACAAVDRTKKK
jgi:hypothetical protein